MWRVMRLLLPALLGLASANEPLYAFEADSPLVELTESKCAALHLQRALRCHAPSTALPPAESSLM